MAKFKIQFRRLLFIDSKVAEGGYPNCRQLAEEWEVSTKTIQRDIDYLRDQLDAPLDYSYQHRGYYYTEPNYRLPTITVSESDLFAVCIAEMALKRFKNTPLYSKLVSVFDKIEGTLPEKVSVHPSWVDSRIFFFSEACTRINPKIWETIARALRQDQRLLITHKSPSRQEPTRRKIDPYHLVNFKGEWYVASYCHSAQSIRTFAVSRIRSAKILDERFEMPAEFTQEKMFGDQFGIIWKPRKYKVRIEFVPHIAPYIRERQWHPLQAIKEKRNGGIVLEFETNHVKEVKDWILSWGCGAKALAPKKLVDEVKESLKNTLKKYGA